MSLFAGMADIFTSTFSSGEVITVEPVGGPARDLTGRAIFRRAGVPVQSADLEFVTSDPTLSLAVIDASGLDADATVTVDGQAFVVTAVYPDGRAMARLVLREA